MSSDRVVRAIRKELVPDQFVKGWIQWGVCAAYYPNGNPSLTPPRAPMTVDVYLDGTQSLPNGHPAKIVTANMRFNEGYAPTVGDVVPVFRGPGQLQTDRFVFRGMAGIRGPGNGAFVGFAPGPPPPTTPWGKGDLYVDPFNYILYGCVVASVQNSSGVVTTPAFFKIFGGEGSTWGLVSNAALSFAGDPNGHVAALEVGDLCVDDTTPALYQATAADNSHWVKLGTGGYLSLTGPGETATPGDLTQAGGFTVNAGAQTIAFGTSGDLELQTDASGKVAFFNVLPVVQQPQPTTLTEVIEYLTFYGLFHSVSSFDVDVIALGPTIYWILNESGGPQATDWSGNGNNGAYSVGGVTYGVGGPVAGSTAVEFDGASGAVTCSYVPADLHRITTFAFFKTLPSTWAPSLISTADCFANGNGFNMLLGTLTGTPTFDPFRASNVNSATPPNDSSWHMVAFSSGIIGDDLDGSGNNFIVVIDGVEVASNNYLVTSWPPSGNTFQAGKPYGADSYYPGNVSRVALWDGTALTLTQIQALWAAV